VQLLYMGLQHVAQKWTQPLPEWKAALNQFVILFGERVPRGKSYTLNLTTSRPVAPEPPPRCRGRRWHPRQQRRCPCRGGAVCWTPARHGVPRVRRRPARPQLPAACHRRTAGRHHPRPLPGLRPASAGAMTGPLQRRGRARDRPRASPLCAWGDRLDVPMAQAAGRQAAPRPVGAVSPRPRPRQARASSSYRGSTSERVCRKAWLGTAAASPTAEPEAGKLHVRVCTGGAG
jgi:hypothetical protein